ncbi:MAG: hypothetical protein KVP17_001555 [Porospora cf. gigantea B]|uniref:uncharacterized protein n=1 Tax=Porospora cf. gigantea A TaxID=2853593 RepID=UPI0035595CAE|nr:MAG: hypothetical protein KVP18_004819 [Porospora cf. gigantea A]KAH0487932.1 MAG: hypothetical protein KVP17_001555 [Porospora cf. gigantea B]
MSVRCLHLLLKHANSRNPLSRRTKRPVKLTPEEAAQELADIEEHLVACTDVEAEFRRIAKDRSDCGSYKKAGDLGFFERGTMQKPFEDVAFALKVGELSSVVCSDTGVHLIYRLE